jgi:hypothetical protein
MLTISEQSAAIEALESSDDSNSGEEKWNKLLGVFARLSCAQVELLPSVEKKVERKNEAERALGWFHKSLYMRENYQEGEYSRASAIAQERQRPPKAIEAPSTPPGLPSEVLKGNRNRHMHRYMLEEEERQIIERNKRLHMKVNVDDYVDDVVEQIDELVVLNKEYD